MYYQPQHAFPMDPASLKQSIQGQVEYYFSTNNLVKDTFLRSNMDEQGFIPLSLLMGFKRLSMLTQDQEAVKDAINNSTVVGFVFEEKM